MIEAWRGVAAWMVVYAHYWAFQGSDWPPLRLAHTGVDLFFVISGFVFAPHLLGRELAVAPYGLRRLFRIYPAYLLALAVYAALKAQEGKPLLYLGEHLSFTHLQSREMAFYYNPPFWSLPAEVEFYLVLPLVALGARTLRRRLGPRGPAWLLAGLLVAAAGLRWALGWASDRDSENTAFIVLHHLPGVLVEFLLGAAAWRLCRAPLAPARRVALGTAGLLGWMLLARWFGAVGDAGVDASAARGLMGALTAACFALMLVATAASAATAGAGVPGPGAARGGMAAFRSALAQWAGRLSYGVYLFHTAALTVGLAWATRWGLGAEVGRWLAVALTLALAAVVHLAWEDPWRRLGRRLALRAGARSQKTSVSPG